MDNQAYKWLREVFEDDILYPHTDGWQMYLLSGDSYPHEVERFRDDMRQLLADAEVGRKLRDGSRDRDFFYKWLRPDLKRD
jgi:hypothetical protein